MFPIEKKELEARHAAVREAIRSPLGNKLDLKTGALYIAEAEVDDRILVKIGFSESNFGNRFGAIEKCGRTIRRSEKTSDVRGAYRAEQIVQKYLQIENASFECPCGKNHREWFDINFDTAFAFMASVVGWMQVEPYDFEAMQLRSRWARNLEVFRERTRSRNPQSVWAFFALRPGTLHQSLLSIKDASAPSSLVLTESLRGPGTPDCVSSPSELLDVGHESAIASDFDQIQCTEKIAGESEESDESNSNTSGTGDSLTLENGQAGRKEEEEGNDSSGEETESSDLIDGGEEEYTVSDCDSISSDEDDCSEHLTSGIFVSELGDGINKLMDELDDEVPSDDNLKILHNCLNPPFNLTTHETALGIACSRGDVASVIKLLCTGVNVNASGGFDGNALSAACRMGHFGIVDLLIQERADIRQSGGIYGHALQAAAAGGYLNIVKLLLRGGAEVNSQGGLFGNATRAAAYYGHREVVQTLIMAGEDGSALSASSQAGEEDSVEFLLQSGAKVNVLPSKFECALHEASDNGYSTIVSMLLKHGADPNMKNTRQETALLVAAKRNHVDVTHTLLEFGAQDRFFSVIDSALYAAAKQGNVRIVKLLLDSNMREVGESRYMPSLGFDKPQKTVSGGMQWNVGYSALGYNRLPPVLHIAASEGHKDIILLLLTYGVDVNQCHIGTALQAASAKGHLEIVKILLENRANVNAPNGTGGSNLYAAALNGHKEIVQTLIKAGADTSALCETVDARAESAVRCLLEAGVNANSSGLLGRNPLYVAVDKGLERIVELLVQYKASLSDGAFRDTMYRAALSGNRRIVSTLIKGGANNDALHTAIRKHDMNSIKILVEEGMSVRERAGTESSALYIASLGGNPKIVAFLLESGADVSATGGWFGNPLQAAAARGNSAVVKLLLKNGADWKCDEGYHETALQAACIGDNGEVVEILLNHVSDHPILNDHLVKPLCTATTAGNNKIVAQLLKAGADPNSQGSIFGSVLHAACALGNISIVRLLLDHGACVRESSDLYCDAYQAACAGDKEREIYKILDDHNLRQLSPRLPPLQKLNITAE